MGSPNQPSNHPPYAPVLKTLIINENIYLYLYLMPSFRKGRLDIEIGIGSCVVPCRTNFNFTRLLYTCATDSRSFA